MLRQWCRDLTEANEEKKSTKSEKDNKPIDFCYNRAEKKAPILLEHSQKPDTCWVEEGYRGWLPNLSVCQCMLLLQAAV